MNEVSNVLIGYEYKARASQICYYDRKAQEPISVPTKLGTNLFSFPTLVCKIEGRDEWHFGLEADYFGKQPGGILIDNLYEFCLGNESRLVDRTIMEPWEILAIFFRESLKMLGLRDMKKSIAGIMVTTQSLNRTLVENVKKAFDGIGFRRDQIYIQDSDESFYYYCFSQKPEIWARKIALFTFSDNKAVFSQMDQDKTVHPALVSIGKALACTLPTDLNERDTAFLDYAAGNMKNDIYTGIFITGDGFDREWARRSVQYLCHGNRHVYFGGNLFVKGACYAILARRETKSLKNYLYLGPDLVKTNVGMEMLILGNPAYYPLIPAGINWFEADASCDLILDDKEDLTFAVNSMDGQNRKYYKMELPNLPKRPNRTTRIHLHANMTSVSECVIEAEDLGFGDMYPASHIRWKETLEF